MMKPHFLSFRPSETRGEIRGFLDFARNDTMENGFTLVELIVSVSITALLMLGMSTFFSGTFRSVFDIQQKAESEQGQFTVNEILRDKFETLDSVVTLNGSEAFLRNETDNGQMPFTYIAEKDSHIVFKDMFVFNDVETVGGDVYYGDSGARQIKKTDGTVVVDNLPLNFGGFATKDGITFYVAIPDGNEVQECDAVGCTPMDFGAIKLSHPTDVDVNPNNGNLYISDSGNDQVVMYNGSFAELIATDLSFPTGLAFYDDGGSGFLFVSNTYDNEIVRLDFSSTKPYTATVIAGDGDNADCDNSARYCQLNFPTGIAVDSVTKTLLIADTGNNRILKITDPGTDLSSVSIDFTLDNPVKISKVEVIFPEPPTIVSSDTTLHGGLGTKELTADTYTFSLEVPIVSGATGSYNDDCTVTTDPVVPYFCRFIVPDSASIFNPLGGDEVTLDGTAYTTIRVYGDPLDFGSGFDEVVVDEKPDLDVANANVSYPDETIASINNDFSGANSFDFDLTGSSFGTFSTLHLDVYDDYDDADMIVTSADKMLRVGDGVLGTEEDTVEVLIDAGLNYPTGLAVMSNSFFVADSLSAQIKSSPIVSPVLSDLAPFSPYSIALTAFDYTSDFETESIVFDSYNSDTLLQLTVNAKVDETTTQTYTINAKIPLPTP